MFSMLIIFISMMLATFIYYEIEVMKITNAFNSVVGKPPDSVWTTFYGSGAIFREKTD